MGPQGLLEGVKAFQVGFKENHISAESSLKSQTFYMIAGKALKIQEGPQGKGFFLFLIF